MRRLGPKLRGSERVSGFCGFEALGLCAFYAHLVVVVGFHGLLWLSGFGPRDFKVLAPIASLRYRDSPGSEGVTLGFVLPLQGLFRFFSC